VPRKPADGSQGRRAQPGPGWEVLGKEVAQRGRKKKIGTWKNKEKFHLANNTFCVLAQWSFPQVD
jgi:hypothetical protein